MALGPQDAQQDGDSLCGFKVGDKPSAGSKLPPTAAADLIRRAVYPEPGCVKSCAVVVGAHSATALSWLRAIFPDRRIAVLSAAALSEVGSDLLALRRWLLEQAGEDPAIAVLVEPCAWFGTSRTATMSVTGLLRQVLDRWEWMLASAPGSRGLSLITLLSSCPSKLWDQAGVFDTVLNLDSVLDEARGALKASSLGNTLVGSLSSDLDSEKLAFQSQGARAVKEWLHRVLLPTHTVAGSISVSSRAPFCVALVGACGTGKTSVLAALGRWGEVTVLPMSVPELINAGIGDTQAAVRRHFERARHAQPSCVTLDDADELFGQSVGDRHSSSHGVGDFLTELLQMLDDLCSPRLLFVTSCSHPQRLPAPLACRLHCIALEPVVAC
ncbi:unnamed protein product [Polarella glacialis]|uniref:ATPase AAA-type core domain-containing protein n=1 Tax=Polarella glacialis TaxID=89957 RepID=A0A813L977_POLGL|nr:unnamed protein product [Polarella glacialis]CAE8719470.1 unnamed protein product [Polarella glacialis]